MFDLKLMAISSPASHKGLLAPRNSQQSPRLMSDMPTALSLLLTRRSVMASFLGDPGPDDAALRTMLTAAMRVPDHGKLAPWRFVVLGREARLSLAPRIEALRKAAEPDLPDERLAKEREAFTSAPCCVVVISTAAEHPKIPLWEQHLSAGASAMNLLHAAHALGFAGQWLTGWAAYDGGAKALLGVKPEETVVGLVHIGAPLAPPTERGRPVLEDHVRFEP